MQDPATEFTVSIAASEEELRAAQALRYEVFVRELGAGGSLVDHDAGLERDRFDPFSDHMLLWDKRRGRAAGVYRLMRGDHAAAAGQFYSETEYDLAPLQGSGRKLLELGRSCVHPDYRGSMAMYHLWSGLATYVRQHEIEILFGVASFHGTEVQQLAEPLSLLHHNHMAPPGLQARSKVFQAMDLVPPDCLDRRRAMSEMPALIKAYLRLGGFVGQGAYVDHEFNTTDVCLILDTERMNTRQSRIYTEGRGAR